MEKEHDSQLFILESEWIKYSKGLDFTYMTYLKQRQEYDNLKYRIKKGYDAKTLHPLLKDK
jgi:hypothetical protein